MSNFEKDWLIEEVNKDPGSPYFPVLSHFHLKNKELKKAIAVCQSGLGIYPESIEGNFIMAQIQILESNLHDAEKTLKFVVNRHSAHVNAWKLLFRIQIDLNKSEKIIKVTVLSLLKIKPKDNECLNWLQAFVHPKEKNYEEINTKIDDNPIDVKVDPHIISISEKVVPISMRMATFTLVEVYKNQGYFHQALEVLKMVEQKGGNKRRLKNMQSQINDAIKAQQEAEAN